MIAGALSFFPPIAAIAGTISLGTAITGYGRGKQDQPPGEAPISGTTAPNILRSTHAVITTVDSGLAELDDALNSSLSRDLSSPTGFLSPHLRLERPDLANGPGAMGTLTIDRYPEPMNMDVVVSMVNLYRAGYVHVPGAAGQYSAASATLVSCVPSGSARSFFPRSVRQFEDARDLLVAILNSTGESLSACGVALWPARPDTR